MAATCFLVITSAVDRFESGVAEKSERDESLRSGQVPLGFPHLLRTLDLSRSFFFAHTPY